MAAAVVAVLGLMVILEVQQEDLEVLVEEETERTTQVLLQPLEQLTQEAAEAVGLKALLYITQVELAEAGE